MINPESNSNQQVIPRALFRYYKPLKTREDYDRLYELFAEDKLYLSNPNSFNDPFDCNISMDWTSIEEYDIERLLKHKEKNHKKNNAPIATAEEIEKFKKIHAEQISSEINKKTKEVGMVCFSKDINNILMWSHYGGSHKGIAFEFQADRFLLKKNLVPIDYEIDYDNQTTPNYKNFVDSCINEPDETRTLEILKPFYRIKAKDWYYEKEWRLLLPRTWPCVKNGRMDIKNSDNKPECPPYMTISGIYFGLNANMESTYNHKIIHWIKNNRPDIKIYKMEKDGHLKLRFEGYSAS